MNEKTISFHSQGLTLAGVLRWPAGFKAGERRPALVVLHGFGSNKGAENVLGPCSEIEAMGYITLRFDMPGCGDSEGPRGHLICMEQVQATLDAVSFMAAEPSVQTNAIGLIGSSFGAAVAVYAGAVDPRIAGVISSGGWGHGENKFRGQHPTPEAWAHLGGPTALGKRQATAKHLVLIAHLKSQVVQRRLAGGAFEQKQIVVFTALGPA